MIKAIQPDIIAITMAIVFMTGCMEFKTYDPYIPNKIAVVASQTQSEDLFSYILDFVQVLQPGTSLTIYDPKGLPVTEFIYPTGTYIPENKIKFIFRKQLKAVKMSFDGNLESSISLSTIIGRIVPRLSNLEGNKSILVLGDIDPTSFPADNMVGFHGIDVLAYGCKQQEIFHALRMLVSDNGGRLLRGSSNIDSRTLREGFKAAMDDQAIPELFLNETRFSYTNFLIKLSWNDLSADLDLSVIRKANGRVEAVNWKNNNASFATWYKQKNNLEIIQLHRLDGNLLITAELSKGKQKEIPVTIQILGKNRTGRDVIGIKNVIFKPKAPISYSDKPMTSSFMVKEIVRMVKDNGKKA